MSKKVDLTGKKYGRLTAIRRTSERKRGRIVWECLCECGGAKKTDTDQLTTGNTKSCGCLQRESRSKTGSRTRNLVHNHIIDLTGQRFGKLVVIKAATKRKNKRVIWECYCDCSQTCFVSASNLRRKDGTRSCGCARVIDLVGRRFGRLVVVRPKENKQFGDYIWTCKCDCGRVKNFSGASLRSGRTSSCGCIRCPDITGKRFANLRVVRRSTQRVSGQIAWECCCDCGGNALVTGKRLKSGHTKSCGCRQVAAGIAQGSILTPDDIPISMVKAKMALNKNRKLTERLRNEV